VCSSNLLSSLRRWCSSATCSLALSENDNKPFFRFQLVFLSISSTHSRACCQLAHNSETTALRSEKLAADRLLSEAPHYIASKHAGCWLCVARCVCSASFGLFARLPSLILEFILLAIANHSRDASAIPLFTLHILFYFCIFYSLLLEGFVLLSLTCFAASLTVAEQSATQHATKAGSESASSRAGTTVAAATTTTKKAETATKRIKIVESLGTRRTTPTKTTTAPSALSLPTKMPPSPFAGPHALRNLTESCLHIRQGSYVLTCYLSFLTEFPVNG
jgi:hypothetical protein